MPSIFTRRAQGAHVPHNKNTAGKATEKMPLPAKIILPMQQHIGAPCAPVVQKGDTVFQVMRNTGVYWKDIIRLNNLQAPNYSLIPGQRLRLK